MSEKNDDRETISQKIERLNELILWFNSDEFSLDRATEVYRTAEELVQEIDKQLRAMKNDIVVLRERFDTKDE